MHLRQIGGSAPSHLKKFLHKEEMIKQARLGSFGSIDYRPTDNPFPVGINGKGIGENVLSGEIGPGVLVTGLQFDFLSFVGIVVRD